MQELEKILEEIEQRIEKAKKIIVEHPSDKMDEIANDTAEAFIEAYKECQDIIRKHMNDGWIPVEDRLPKGDGNDGELIVTDKDGRVWSGIYYGITEETDEEPCFHKWDEEMWHCYKPDVIAWRPLPEPYRPERSDNHDGE